MRKNNIYKLKKKLWFRNYKRTLKCTHCPENHYACLEFHHRDGADKDGTVSKMVHDNARTADILAEIAKCTVLCSNCHKKLHAELNEAVWPETRWTQVVEEWESHRQPKGRPAEHCHKMTQVLQEKYADPVWRAEQGQRIREGRAKKKAERLASTVSLSS